MFSVGRNIGIICIVLELGVTLACTRGGRNIDIACNALEGRKICTQAYYNLTFHHHRYAILPYIRITCIKAFAASQPDKGVRLYDLRYLSKVCARKKNVTKSKYQTRALLPVPENTDTHTHTHTHTHMHTQAHSLPKRTQAHDNFSFIAPGTLRDIPVLARLARSQHRQNLLQQVCCG